MRVHVLYCILELSAVIVKVQLFKYSFKWRLNPFNSFLGKCLKKVLINVFQGKKCGEFI